MKNNWPTRFWLSGILAGCICLSGCSSQSPGHSNTGPATTVAYMIGNVSTEIKEYSTVIANNGSPINTITFPPSCYGGPLATDSSGQIYVGVAISPVDPLNLGEILIYPPNSTGTATPSRTIGLNSYDIFALAVDPAGLLYVLYDPMQEGSDATPTVTVYSATASGTATPLRTLQLTNLLPTFRDIAADAAGNLYVAGFFSDSTGNAIAVYPPTATGLATPTRMITFGASTVYGVAVDPAGDVFVNICRGCYDGANAIEEFAPGANGAATPINTINLTAKSPWVIVNGGPVHLDSAGNIFTSLELFSNSVVMPLSSSIVVYGFGPTATGSTAPIVQITPTDGYTTSFALN